MKKTLDKSTNLAQLIAENPDANELLLEYGLYCGNCFAAGFDTLEQGAQLHGMSDEEVDELVEYLNANLATAEESELPQPEVIIPEKNSSISENNSEISQKNQ
jgi:hybrid cluster-associated redox disulfide protein